MSLIYNNLELKGKNIIIVEDDIPSVKYYKTILENSGAELKVFENGKDFTDYLNNTEEHIDIVLLDFLIPIINGIDCVRVLRKTNRNSPVLMITAYYSESTRSEALIAGCNEYILKPIYPEKLLCLLEKYLKPEHSYSVSR
ncbi:MAG TPA: response regulator [Bacteroidales bacterium]|nr:response regulator [Bacteroidales bacterium]HOK74858.1 response regulator [Bacteroidales bacterium]HOM40347.1 response regulator [Bacteroidales bacterium]HOU31168.1 response regulator [Bacteroidales bacterium]HPP92978.1 response regulator [Bacteroidales bacterium]